MCSPSCSSRLLLVLLKQFPSIESTGVLSLSPPAIIITKALVGDRRRKGKWNRSERVLLVVVVGVADVVAIVIIVLVAGNKVLFVVFPLLLLLLARITRQRPSVRRACPPWGACSRSAACRSWGRAFGTCRRCTRWSAQPGPPSSGRTRCGPAASWRWPSSPASSVGIAVSGVHEPCPLWVCVLWKGEWTRVDHFLFRGGHHFSNPRTFAKRVTNIGRREISANFDIKVRLDWEFGADCVEMGRTQFGDTRNVGSPVCDNVSDSFLSFIYLTGCY